jgi:hypothetical protein
MRVRSDTQRIADLEEMVCVISEERRQLALQVSALEHKLEALARPAEGVRRKRAA